MRNLVFDLSADSYLSQSDFAGFEGEHNATCLTLILPERLKVEGAEFYLVFELQKSKETVFSAPLFLENGALSLRLPRQLMSSPGTAVYAAAYRREGGELLQIAKSGKVFLEIKEPEDGVLVSFSAEGGTAPGLVIEKEIVSGSRNPLSSDAVYRALEKLATKDSVKNEFSKTEKELSSLKTKDEKTEKELLDLKEENEALQNAIQTLSEENDKLNEEILDLKGENDLLSAEMDMLSEEINAQQKEILLSNLTGKGVGENAVRIDDALEENPEISVKLSGLVNYEPDYVLHFYSTDHSIDISLNKGQGLYTVKSVDTENTKVVFEDDSYIFDDFTPDFCSKFSVGENVWFDGQFDFYRTAKTPFDYSAVTLKKYGKNLLNRKKAAISNGTLIFSDNRQTFTSTGGGDFNIVLGKYKDFVGKTITISYDYIERKSSIGRNSFSTILLADATQITNFYVNVGNKASKTITIPENDEAENLVLRQYYGYVTSAEGDYIVIENLQVEIGNRATEWEEYKEPVAYESSSDGAVFGVEGFFPSTTLFADYNGTKIEAEYRRDLRRVIERMEKAIVSLGGNL